MKALLRAELRRALRTPAFLIGNLTMPIGMCMLMGTHADFRPPTPVSATAYFTIALATFSAVSAAINTSGIAVLRERHRGWTRQLSLSGLPGWKYLLLKLVVSAVSCLVAIVVILGVVGLLTTAHGSWGTTALAALALWLGMLVLCLLGILVGYAFSETYGGLVCITLHLLFSVLGGLLWPVETYPGWLRSLGELTPAYHLVAIAHSVQGGQVPQLGNVLVLLGYLLAVVVGLVFAFRRDATAAWTVRQKPSKAPRTPHTKETTHDSDPQAVPAQ